MKSINVYLNFDGNTREAMTFYAVCLGGDLQIMPFGEGNCSVPPEHKDRVMHARITKGDLVIMASDTPPEHTVKQGNNFWISLNCDSQQEIEKLFTSIGEGGTVVMPLQDMFWGAHWGCLTDKFGIGWMFNFEKTPQA